MLLLSLMVAGATAEAPAGAAPAAASPAVHEVRFAPLKREWSSYSRLGPAGPYYPDDAAQAGVGGHVIIQCKVAEGGALDDCRVLAEKPTKYNFGAAATVLAKRGRIFIADDTAAGETVVVHVPFQPGGHVEIER